MSGCGCDSVPLYLGIPLALLALGVAFLLPAMAYAIWTDTRRSRP